MYLFWVSVLDKSHLKDMLMWRLAPVFSLVMLCAIAGCSDHHYYVDTEEALDTSGYYGQLERVDSKEE